MAYKVKVSNVGVLIDFPAIDFPVNVVGIITSHSSQIERVNTAAVTLPTLSGSKLRSIVYLSSDDPGWDCGDTLSGIRIRRLQLGEEVIISG